MSSVQIIELLLNLRYVKFIYLVDVGLIFFFRPGSRLDLCTGPPEEITRAFFIGFIPTFLRP